MIGKDGVNRILAGKFSSKKKPTGKDVGFP
jgi:hypothetical protein